MKKTFDRKYIENILKDEDTSFSEKIYFTLLNVVGLAVEDLSTKVPFITIDNVIIQPVNETFNGAMTPMSKYVYYFGVASPQLEYNCLYYKDGWKKFKKRFARAWQDSKRKSKRKLKKELLKKQLQGPEYEEFEPEKYNLESLKKDLQNAIAAQLSETSLVYNLPNKLVIQGKDDFGSISQIELIPVIYDGTYFKYFINRRKGFMNINMDERLINFNIKYELAGDNFLKMIKIFNNLFKNLTKEIPSQFFIESLLYNVPDNLFVGNDLYQITVNIINYLQMTSVEDFVAIHDKKSKIFKSELTKDSAIIYNKFIKNV